MSQNDDEPNNEEIQSIYKRRQFLSKIISSSITTASAVSILGIQNPIPSIAEEVAIVQNTIEMKTFVDPKGLFAINVPKRFFAIRRTVKGDLPDEATGKGRRGSSIFTAGDMAKAEVVAIERYV